MHPQLTKKTAIKFVILLGMVSLFADVTYEGARSITGQYLAILGASGTVVGIVAGLGELIGYGFRLVSGYISDKTRQYWLITIIGYTLNLLAVPLLALAGNWPLAAFLMILERLGKSIRTPARDAMLSYATKEMGHGWGFGLHGAMDQIGAITGPLIVSAVLYFNGSYQTSFAILLIPALCAISVLLMARFLYPKPQDLEVVTQKVHTQGFSRWYWLYIGAVCCIAAGYTDFALIAFHFGKNSILPEAWIPVFFAIAMAADGLSGLLFGKLYDKRGISILMPITALSAMFAPLVFLGGFYYALMGMILWGVGTGSQESVMRAVVANLIQKHKRGTGYGTMNMCYGAAWFLGSALMGYLYDHSLISLIIFSVGSQLAAIPIFFALRQSE